MPKSEVRMQNSQFQTPNPSRTVNGESQTPNFELRTSNGEQRTGGSKAWQQTADYRFNNTLRALRDLRAMILSGFRRRLCAEKCQRAT
jgi:hypothetical protein